MTKPARTCGGCTACCAVVPVSEIGNAPYAGCVHMRSIIHAAGPGCAIYQHRPGSCRAWSCMWLNRPDWPDEYRPDRIGLVVDENLDLIMVDRVELAAAQIWVMPGHADDYTLTPGWSIIQTMLQSGYAVLWRLPPGTSARVFRRGEGDQTLISQVVPTPKNTQHLPPSDVERMLRAEALANRGRR